MSVPDAAVTFLLENLTHILAYNYHLVADVRGNIEKLKTELLLLQKMMTDFQKYNNDSEYVEQTAKEIRKILDEAEDAVDAYILQASVHKLRGFLSKAFHQVTDYPGVLRNVSLNIENLAAKVKKINDENVEKGLQVLKFQAEFKQKNAARQHEAPQVEEDNVIGFEKAAEAVEKLLVEGEENLQVVSIVGMLGLGKTTLAKKVYKDPDVDYEYMIRAFVYVSQEYEKREVLLSIVNSFCKASEEVNNMTEQQLETHLYKELLGKQYLIVLDDVWETRDWDKLKAAFPNNDKRCRVLITTRNAHVAVHANHESDSLYRLDFLPLEESRKLLRWRVFHMEELDESYSALTRHEIDIAKKCDGLPLALVVIAGILVNHPNRVDWWNEVADSVKDYIARDVTQTTTVIELMYKHLPNYLKPCFLYLGVFREDSEISVWKLVRLWISEGFIPQLQDNINLEETAEIYLNELVQRNLVMVGKLRKNERVKTCRMHDTLREFCKKEAAKDNIFQEIKRNLNQFSADNPALDDYRRLCNNNPNILEYISGVLRGKRVRSFLTFVKEDTSVEAKLVSCIPKAFKLLRVLEAQSLIFARFPSDLCNLVLLKYVAISSTFSTLPAAMSSLWNLQTLIVVTNSRTLDIKADLWKMPQFRHLHTNASATLPTSSTTKSQKVKLDQFPNSNIQTLSTISPESCTQELFARAPKVRKLGIYGELDKLFNVKSSFLPHLPRLEALENLKLLNDDSHSKIYKLPNEFPRRLTKITLMNTRLEWKEMSTLGGLEGLEILKLKEYSFQGSLWNTAKGGFQVLTHLFVGQTDLVVWGASKDNFPKLKSLELNGCDKLEAIPHGLADIPSLQMVVLHCTNPMVASSARRLQVLKLEQQAKKGNKNSINFKLSVYPPGH